ncbi:MAG: hypothetical protein Q7T74_01685 [Candidatus Saccharibacteria bacterium]|nr:hypothetical protein [Candidatus Saccharibacteria bacterium]
MKPHHVVIITAEIGLAACLLFLVLLRINEPQVALVVTESTEVCVKNEAVTVKFSHNVYVESRNRPIRVTGLIFTACIKQGTTVDQKLINNAYEIAKEVVYQKDFKDHLETVEDVKAAAAEAVFTYMNSFSQYEGKLLFTVDTVQFDVEVLR